jgi:hypothetical protein
MKSAVAVIALLVLGAGTTRAAAEAGRWSVEPRGGGGAPTGTFEPGELGMGLGLGATVAYRLQPHLHAYSGWGWHHFAVDAPVAGEDVDLEQTGYVFGLRFVHPFSDASSLAYRIHAGGTYEHLEIEEPGRPLRSSGHGVGWEAGAGLVVPWRSGWEFSPGVGYRSLSRDIDLEPTPLRTELRYVVFDVGLTRRF